MPKKYYTVVSKSSEPYDNNDWCIEYGSYERSDCAYEVEEMKDKAKNNQERIQYKIITTGDTQAEVSAKVAEMNQ